MVTITPRAAVLFGAQPYRDFNNRKHNLYIR